MIVVVVVVVVVVLLLLLLTIIYHTTGGHEGERRVHDLLASQLHAVLDPQWAFRFWHGHIHRQYIYIYIYMYFLSNLLAPQASRRPGASAVRLDYITPGFLIKKLHIKKFRGWVSVKKCNSVNSPRLK